jgi:acetylornithine deacetylase/succinyl-diaminopimelate desuccinylase-like protein
MDEESLRLLKELVALDTTNIEDPVRGHFEKRHHEEAAQFIVSRAKALGLQARIWDALEDLHGGKKLFAQPRPNVILDLERGKARTLLLLAHYDVVPVPEEQLKRWKSDPHILTPREDGRLYGRGSNDDLGSGVVSGLTALRHLSQKKDLQVNVRMIVCCDEETGGAGGIEALREHDMALPPKSPDRFIHGDLAILPDGSPYVAAGSSGVTFIEVAVPLQTTLSQYLRVVQGAIDFHRVAVTWTSALRSPPEPSGPPPHEYITGRATVTKMDLTFAEGKGNAPCHLLKAHANSEAANQIPATVTVTLGGSEEASGAFLKFLHERVKPPFRVETQKSSKGLALDIVGRSGHGGYPHRAANPVPETVRLLSEAVRRGVLEDEPVKEGAMTLDLRSPPEMESASAYGIFESHFRALQTDVAGVTAIVPPGRARSGYFLSPTDPVALRIQKLFTEVSGRPIGIYGEYGGTDASALRNITTPDGKPLPAVVLGSMDQAANMHDAEESLDPNRFREVVDLLVRLAENPP